MDFIAVRGYKVGSTPLVDLPDATSDPHGAWISHYGKGVGDAFYKLYMVFRTTIMGIRNDNVSNQSSYYRELRNFLVGGV